MSPEHDPVQAANALVDAQCEKFRAELPALLAGEHAGRWVAYLDGVRSAHDDEREAYRWGCEHLGYFSGFCVVRVEPERAIYFHDALRFFA